MHDLTGMLVFQAADRTSAGRRSLVVRVQDLLQCFLTTRIELRSGDFLVQRSADIYVESVLEFKNSLLALLAGRTERVQLDDAADGMMWIAIDRLTIGGVTPENGVYVVYGELWDDLARDLPEERLPRDIKMSNRFIMTFSGLHLHESDIQRMIDDLSMLWERLLAASWPGKPEDRQTTA